jgi:hypothetical protein
MRFDDVSPALRHEYMDAIQTDLGRIHADIASQYFGVHWQQASQVAPAA